MMGGHSTLEDNLVDDLVGDVIDDLRSELYDSMGTRQHDVYIVRRTWSGPARQEGTIVRTDAVLMDPPPLFSDMTKFELTGAGRTNEGDAKLTEVSLTYTEEELLGGVIPKNVEFYYRVVDKRGQGIAPAYYVPNGKVRSDREKTIGWIVNLTRAEVEG